MQLLRHGQVIKQRSPFAADETKQADLCPETSGDSQQRDRLQFNRRICDNQRWNGLSINPVLGGIFLCFHPPRNCKCTCNFSPKAFFPMCLSSLSYSSHGKLPPCFFHIASSWIWLCPCYVLSTMCLEKPWRCMAWFGSLVGWWNEIGAANGEAYTVNKLGEMTLVKGIL